MIREILGFVLTAAGIYLLLVLGLSW